MLPSHFNTSSVDSGRYDDDHLDDDVTKPRRISRTTLLLRRVTQDPSLLLNYKPHLAALAVFVLVLFLLLRPSSPDLRNLAIRWDGRAAQNWGDYVGLGLARAKVLESTPAGYADLSDKWVGGAGALYAARPRAGSPSPSAASVVQQEAGKTTSLLRDSSFDRDRHGVLGGASTEWSSGVVGMGAWLGETVDMRKDSARVDDEEEEEEVAKLKAREALTAHIIKRGWEYLDTDDEANTKKLLAEAERDGTKGKLPLRDQVRGDPDLQREAAMGWSRIFGAMEGEGLKSALEVAIEKLVRRSPMVVFSKTTCPHSKRAKELLQKYHLSPEPYFVEVDMRPDGKTLKALLTRKTAHGTFPNIIIGSRSIGGADDLERLEREGEGFRKLLKDAGITVHGRS